MAQISDPEAWINTLIANPRVLQENCGARFHEADVNKDGFLQWSELCELCADLSSFLGIDAPREEKLRIVFDKFDKNHDGKLSPEDFRNLFEAFLKSSLAHLRETRLNKERKALEEERKARVISLEINMISGELLARIDAEPDWTIDRLGGTLAESIKEGTHISKFCSGGQVLNRKLTVLDAGLRNGDVLTAVVVKTPPAWELWNKPPKHTKLACFMYDNRGDGGLFELSCTACGHKWEAGGSTTYYKGPRMCPECEAT